MICDFLRAEITDKKINRKVIILPCVIVSKTFDRTDPVNVARDVARIFGLGGGANFG